MTGSHRRQRGPTLLTKGSTLRYVLHMSVLPSRATDRLLGDPQHLRHGVVAWLLIGILYGLTALTGGLNGFGAVLAPWVPIPAAVHYQMDGTAHAAD